MKRESKEAADRTQRRRKVDDIPLTPMIDVVFQLLVFFVLTFEPVNAFAHLAFNRPAAGPDDVTICSFDHVRIRITPSGYLLNDRAMTLERLDDVLQRLADLDHSQLIIIEAEERSQHDRLVQTMNLCIKHQLSRISILSLGD